jgi:hypothetical protein
MEGTQSVDVEAEERDAGKWRRRRRRASAAGVITASTAGKERRGGRREQRLSLVSRP